jgi:hypothetical protein
MSSFLLYMSPSGYGQFLMTITNFAGAAIAADDGFVRLNIGNFAMSLTAALDLAHWREVVDDGVWRRSRRRGPRAA